MLNILFKIGGYSAEITLHRHTYTRQNQYVKITSDLILENVRDKFLQRQRHMNLYRKTTAIISSAGQAAKVHRRMRQDDKSLGWPRRRKLNYVQVYDYITLPGEVTDLLRLRSGVFRANVTRYSNLKVKTAKSCVVMQMVLNKRQRAQKSQKLQLNLLMREGFSHSVQSFFY